MATAKSTYNSKLASVTDIKFCTAAGKNMTTKLYTQENGRYSIFVGFKQPSKKTNPYQVQHRVRSRWTKANAKAKGADWTSWSGWSNTVAMSGIPLGSTKNPDTWLKANVGVNTKGTYRTCYHFNNTAIAATYDARHYQFRVRTYNAKTRKHGKWVTSAVLAVYKSVAIENETIHRGGGGQLMFDCNYKENRGGTVHINSIKDSAGKELLKAVTTIAMNYDSQRKATSVPPKRTDWTPGEFELASGKHLKRTINYGETLTWNAWYQSTDGAKTYLQKSITVKPESSALHKPLVNITESTDGMHILTVKVTKGAAADEVLNVSSSISYSTRGSIETIKPTSSSIDLGATGVIATFVYMNVPLNVRMTISASVSDDYHTVRTVAITRTVFSKWWLLTPHNGNTLNVAALQWDRSLTRNAEAKATTGLPYGRTKEFAAFSPGRTHTITLSGKILDYDKADWDELGFPASAWNPQASVANWNRIQNNFGIYYLRSPRYGDVWKVAVISISENYSAPDERLIELTVTMKEVT